MANEFKVKNGLIVVGDLTTSGTITINGALAATQSWVSSQSYLTSANLSGYATQSYVTSAIASLVDSAPATLDTLKELATALGNDASFATTITNSIASKLSLSGGTMTGQILFQTSALNNGFRWDVNSDAAGITFKNTGDGDNNSYFNFFTEDNGNEYFKFSHNTWNIGSFDFMDVKNGVIRTNGDIYVNASQSGSRSAGTNELINGSRVWHSGDFSSTNVSNWNTAYSWGNHASAGYLTSVTNISGYSGTLLREDNRTISPSELAAGQLKFGFTSWTNDNSGPYADFLHLRSYTDASGGDDNLVMFKKSGIGMRIWQQTWGSSTPYSSYADVWTTGNFTQTNVNNWNTAYGWGNHASAGYVSTSGSYANPSWITSLAYSKITGVPAFLTAESDTLNSVATRGNTTGNAITAGGLNSTADYSLQVDSGSTNVRMGRFKFIRSTYNPTGVSASIDFWRGGSAYEGMLAFSTNGGTIGDTSVERMRITDTGNVGIGTSNPSVKLDVAGNASFGASQLFKITDNGSGNFVLGGATVNTYIDGVTFRVRNSTGDVTVYADGTTNRVGIGTTSPSQKLEVNGNIGVPYTGYLISTTDTGNSIQLHNGSGVMNFYTNGSIRLSVAYSTGNVGIGTASPAEKLSLAGSTATTFGLSLEPSGWNSAKHRLTVPISGDVSMWSFNWNGTAVDSALYAPASILMAQGTITFNTTGSANSPAARMIINSAGNVGIGATSLEAKLHVVSGASQAGILSRGVSGDTWFPYVNGQNYVRGVTNFDLGSVYFTGGNIGIGTSSPSENLHVLGRGIFDGGSGNSSTDAVLYVTKSNNNDWGLYVNAVGLDYGMYSRVSPSAGYAIAVNNGTTWTTRITGNAIIYLGEKNAIEGNYDSWLRLNNSNHYASGVYTPGVMRADGGFQVSGYTVIHSGTIGSQSVASANTSTSTYRGIIEDTRAAERTPSDYDDYRVSWEFTNQIPGLNYGGSSWWSAMTMQGWGNGYSAWQIIGSASSAIDDFYLRAGNNTTWNTARRIWHSGDFTSSNVSNWNTAYSWGNHASAGYQSASTAITTSNIGSQSVSYASTAGTATSATTALTVTAQSTISKAAHTAGASDYHLQLYSSDQGDSSKEVSIRFHQGNVYWAQLRYRSGGFRFTGGGDDSLVPIYADTFYTASGNSSQWQTAYGWGNHASQSYATTSYVTTQINNLVNGAPGALDTLSELATALGNDASFATTVTNSIAGKVSKSGDVITTSNNYGLVINHTPVLGDFVDALTLRSTTSGQRAQMGFATVDSDGDHHRVSIRAYKGAQAFEGVFGVALRQPNTTHVQRLTLDYLGNLTIGGALTESSSLKLKENVETSEGNLEKVVNLRPVTYNKIGSETKELGLIAEEVAQVYPEFVQYDENGEPIGVNYSRLTAALIGAVKQLTKRIETLENNG
jgi:Chaperone of endosialidase